MIPPGPLRELRDLDQTSPQFHERLSDLLRGNECQRVILGLQGEDLVWLVEYLDTALATTPDPTSLKFKELLHELGKICGAKEVLPKSCAFPSPPSAEPNNFGAILDGSMVRVKLVQARPSCDLRKVKETFHQVAVVWKHLKHRNIVLLQGVTTSPLQFISDRMSGGHLTEYVTSHADADRLSLLSDVAVGLNYLHSYDMIHGRLKASSILVDETGRARIADFGLAPVTQDLDLIRSASTECDNGTRWIAPEILDGRGTYSKEADVFSFAGVMIEAFTCTAPFSDKPPGTAMSAFMGGERPPRPTHPDLTDGLWELIQNCWDHEAHLRPHALQISRGFGVPVWKCLVSCPINLDERVSLVAGVFSDLGEIEAVKQLREVDAQSFINTIDEILDRLAPDLRRKCLSTLCRICGRQALLPRSVQIPLCYDRLGTPLYRGGYGDVWDGEHEGRRVAVKVLTVYMSSDLRKLTRRFCKEVMTWKSLRHQNVLPLLGVTMTNSQFAMVSEWMVNGNINEFTDAYRDVNRFELLVDVTRGLMYMHAEGMIHGDLKGANILIDGHHHACLADFGLITIVSDPAYPPTSSSYTNGGTTRWMSPELLDPSEFGLEDSRRTKESDCYALGMVVYEVLSGQAPFGTQYTKYVVTSKIIDGERPGVPEGPERVWFTDDLWETLELCWSRQPEGRPTIGTVSECLARASPAWHLPPLLMNRDVGIDTDESFFTASSPGSRIPPSPQSCVGAIQLPQIYQPQESNTEAPARAVNEASLNYLEENPYLRTTNPLPTQDYAGQAIHRVGTEEGDGGADEMPTLTAGAQRVDRNTSVDLTAIYGQPSLGLSITVTSESDSALAPLTKIVNWDGTPQDIEHVLIAAFGAEDYLDCIKNLRAQNIEPQSYVDHLDRIIDGLAADSDLRNRCIRALSGVCGLHGIIPTSHLFRGNLTKPNSPPFASSVTFDVWRLTDEIHRSEVFAVKSLRVCDKDPAEKMNEKYCKEVIVSKRLNHPNILSIEGVAPNLFGFCIVSRWMKHGNILEYVKEYPEVDRLQLLIGITRGLDYLHNNEIIYGDLKSPNILIDAEGNPRLYDFANCPFTEDPGEAGGSPDTEFPGDLLQVSVR